MWLGSHVCSFELQAIAAATSSATTAVDSTRRQRTRIFAATAGAPGRSWKGIWGSAASGNVAPQRRDPGSVVPGPAQQAQARHVSWEAWEDMGCRVGAPCECAKVRSSAQSSAGDWQHWYVTVIQDEERCSAGMKSAVPTVVA